MMEMRFDSRLNWGDVTPVFCGRLRRAVAVLLLMALALNSNAVRAQSMDIMLFGDSLMAGYGLPPEQGFQAALQDKLVQRGYGVAFVNAAVSGDTSGAALARLPAALAKKPDAVIVGLGGNDMLQGLPPDRVHANLARIVEGFQAEGIPVLLLGMLASPRLGDRYVSEFNSIYPELASRYDVALYPFFLDGVALDASLNQADRIHPNAQGVQAIVERVAPIVAAFIEALQ